MGKTFKRRAIKQHKEMLEDDRYQHVVVPDKKRKQIEKKPTQQELLREILSNE